MLEYPHQIMEGIIMRLSYLLSAQTDTDSWGMELVAEICFSGHYNLDIFKQVSKFILTLKAS